MGEEISLCDQQLGKQLGRCQFFLSVFRRYPQNYVYNKYHRRLNRQYRKVTKTKECVSKWYRSWKMLFLASRNVTRKWTQRYRNWDQVLNQLIIYTMKDWQHTCKKTGVDVNTSGSCLHLIPSAFIVFPEIPPYSWGRVWAEPTKRDCWCRYLCCKKF